MTVLVALLAAVFDTYNMAFVYTAGMLWVVCLQYLQHGVCLHSGHVVKSVSLAFLDVRSAQGSTVKACMVSLETKSRLLYFGWSIAHFWTGAWMHQGWTSCEVGSEKVNAVWACNSLWRCWNACEPHKYDPIPRVYTPLCTQPLLQFLGNHWLRSYSAICGELIQEMSVLIACTPEWLALCLCVKLLPECTAHMHAEKSTYTQ